MRYELTACMTGFNPMGFKKADKLILKIQVYNSKPYRLLLVLLVRAV